MEAAASFPRQTLFLAQGIAALDFPLHARLPLLAGCLTQGEL